PTSRPRTTEDAPLKSAPTPARPPSAAFAAPTVKKPVERKTRAVSVSNGSTTIGNGAEVKPVVEKSVSRAKSIGGGLYVAFGSSTPAAVVRKMSVRKPAVRAQAKGANPLKPNTSTAPNPVDAMVRASSPESSDG
ncbi:hypothetical protein HK097_006092, partial [Rhizophlyctis rosea]